MRELSLKMTRSNVGAARVNGCSLVVATICACVLPEGAAHAVSRLGDGHLVLAVMEGAPRFGVDRYLGPISLFYTRKFSFHAGEAEVSMSRAALLVDTRRSGRSKC